LKVVCIGNSIVNGFPWPRSSSFSSVLRRKAGWEVINKGINGDITDNIKKRFAHDVLDHRPDMVMILTGTNDHLMGGHTPEETAAALMDLRDMAISAGIEPVLMTPLLTFPPQASECWMKGAGIDYEKVNDQLTELADIIRTSGCRYVDLQEGYKSYGKYYDGVHPDEKGQEIIASLIESSMTAD